ncbi:MAG: glutamate--cysteine ligase [Winogradskyella sp.]|nr:glutamate--cysteine ligase [Winogradskyella sp.]
MGKKYHLFEVYGIELEYMLVNHDLSVAPIVDKLMMLKEGEITSDVDNGNIAWSNELVAHVIELKTNGPTAQLNDLGQEFHKNILEINRLLQPLGTKLLGTAANPLMNPTTDTVLWKHTYSEVYNLYNAIFNCTGHGWSNVQSTHINLPFYNDEEFEKLHAAIRLVLPLIPGLCASSPILEGNITGFADTRLEYYKNNQKKIPHLTAKVIPEPIFNKDDYYKSIFNPIKKAIKPYDKDNILEHHFLNSRGAIARFDRNAIEIRLVDIQECPKADIAICVLIIEVLKALVNNNFESLEKQKLANTDALYAILNATIKNGEDAVITDETYLQLFKLSDAQTIGDIWLYLYLHVKPKISPDQRATLESILNSGTLSKRIVTSLGKDITTDRIIKVYNDLAEGLNTNELFLP